MFQSQVIVFEVKNGKITKKKTTTSKATHKFKKGDAVVYAEKFGTVKKGTKGVIYSKSGAKSVIPVYTVKLASGQNFISPETVLQLPKKKLTKKELEEANPAPKAIKPKSITVTTAVKDVLGLDKYNHKEVSPLKANLVYNLFKNADLDQVEILAENPSDYALGVLKKDGPFHSTWPSDEIELTDLGRDFVRAVNNRLESLRNQKNNYALFDGLNGAKTEFNRHVIQSAKKGYSAAEIFILGYPQGELKKHLPAYQITLSGRVLKKAMAQTKDHNLNWGNIVDLPKNINNPQAIFKSKSRGFVVLTYVKDVNKKPVMVAVHLKNERNNLSIASIYARSNFNTYKNWIKEGLALFVDKKSELFPYAQATIAVGGNNPQGHKNTKTKPNSKKNGLKSPTIEPKPTEGGPSYSGESPRPLISGKHPKVRSIKHQAEKNPMFAIGGETGRFLQAVEKKPFGSVVVTLDGPQGAGKTTALYKFQNDFATAGNRCLFASLEEHPSSNLATDKKDAYLTPAAQENIDTVGSFANYAEFCEIVNHYDCIFIDSWQKLVRMIGAIRLDEDVRKKFNGKVFFVIFQQTTVGRTKGGAEIVFDGDIIIKIEKFL